MSYASREAYNARKVAAETRRRARLVSGAISSRTRAHRWHRLVTAPGVVALQTGGGGAGPTLGAVRGIVTGWSERSQYRLGLAVAMIEWPSTPLVFLTLTYPRHFEADPKVWKEHLRRYQIAWARRWGTPRGLWAMEFQRRGAPHFHLAVVQPPAVKVALLRRWSAHVWYELAGHGDERHLKQHMKPDHCKRADGPRGLIGYLRRELGKERQKSLPEWLAEPVGGAPARGAGRWWGIWGFDRTVEHHKVTAGEYQPIRRLIRRLLRDRGVGARVGWKWECRTLFDKARRQWTLARELLRYVAMIRAPSGDRLLLPLRDRLRLTPVATVAVATFNDFDLACRMRGAQLGLGL